MRYLSDMKCPVCNKLMREGYVRADRGIYWAEKESNFAIGDTKLVGFSLWKRKKVLACICIPCKVVLFSYKVL